MGDSVSTIVSWLQTLVFTGGTLAMGLLGVLYMYQDKLLYFPTMPGVSKLTTDNPEGYRTPGEYGIDYEDVYLPCSDGVKIHAWLMKQPSPKQVPTIVFFHGNAGNIGYRLPNAVKMFNHLECNIFLVDYRGFGLSDGFPTERGLQLDGEAALDYLRKRPDIDPSKLILFGRSLGGAVAIYLAETRSSQVSALIVENTFLSISTMVDQLMPWLSYVKPVVLKIDWSNERRIARITQPILFVAGQRDELVPPSHMKELHALASKSVMKKWLPIARGTHNDSWLRGGIDYFHNLRNFIETVCDLKLQGTAKSPETCESANDISDTAIPNMLNQPLFQHVTQKNKDD